MELGPTGGLWKRTPAIPNGRSWGLIALLPFCLSRRVFRLRTSQRGVAAACSALQWSRSSARSPSKPWRSEWAPPPLPLDRSMTGPLWMARQARGAANRRQCASCAALRPAWCRVATRHRCLISLRAPRDPPTPVGCHRRCRRPPTATPAGSLPSCRNGAPAPVPVTMLSGFLGAGRGLAVAFRTGGRRCRQHVAQRNVSCVPHHVCCRQDDPAAPRAAEQRPQGKLVLRCSCEQRRAVCPCGCCSARTSEAFVCHLARDASTTRLPTLPTFCRSVCHTARLPQIGCIVNDVASVNIDAKLIRGAAGPREGQVR